MMLLLWHIKFAKAAVVYNIAVFLAFVMLYLSIDFGRHFEFVGGPGGEQPSARSIVYFALMTHTAIGCSDIVPRTDFARGAVSAHALLAWMQVVLFVFLHNNGR